MLNKMQIPDSFSLSNLIKSIKKYPLRLPDPPSDTESFAVFYIDLSRGTIMSRHTAR